MSYPKDYLNKSLDEMAVEVRKLNFDMGWRPNTNTFGDYIALLHSEVSEALEAFRKNGLEDDTEIVHGSRLPKPEGVGSELADLLIRLLGMADLYDIDLAKEYERKMAYNRTRPYWHGGKAL